VTRTPFEIQVLFDRGGVLAVCKPEGLASIPERTKDRDSLLVSLQSSIPDKLYVVHRLDKDVSGVMLFARTAAAHRCLNDQFAKRRIAKTYLALVHGALPEDAGTIDRPIREFGSGRMGVDAKHGKASASSYEVVRRMGHYTLVTVRTATGRRHQIRVHFYSIGHPVVGDLRYGDKSQQERFPRLMLHAASISFELPSGEAVAVEAPVSGTFSAVLDAAAR